MNVFHPLEYSFPLVTPFELFFRGRVQNRPPVHYAGLLSPGYKNTKNPVGYVKLSHRLSSEVPPKCSSCQWLSWKTKCKQAPGVKGKSLRFVLKGTCRPCSSKRKLEVLTSCPVRCHMSSAIANLMSSTVPVAAALQSTTSTTGTLVTITANHWALDSRFVPSSRFAASASLFILTVKQVTLLC